jgi:phosphatidylglycerophosphate synthase
VLGKPVLAHLIELATPLCGGPIAVHARYEEHVRIRQLAEHEPDLELVLFTGPPPEGAAVLRTDRLYDPGRLRRALRRGTDPESAAIWRLDQPLGLAGAAEELKRRQTYQPLGRYWALAPARLLARVLCPTGVHPNALTLAAAALMIGSAVAIASAPTALFVRAGIALALALALVLDTADGHLARLQGTASALGQWLDITLDELSDMALHAAVAWAAYARTREVGWLLVGMLYGMGKYVFTASNSHAPVDAEKRVRVEMRPRAIVEPKWSGGPAQARTEHAQEEPYESLRRLISMALNQAARVSRLAGHADVRWHLWIIFAAIGRLDWELAVYAFYYPARALAGAVRKVGRYA